MSSARWSDVPLGSFYSDQTNLVSHIYEPGFRHAGKYIRDTGSFSSNVYYLMGAELLKFLLRDDDNHMTLICSVNIRPQDVDAIFESPLSLQEGRKYLISELNKHIESGKEISNPVKMLVSLISSNKMSLIINLRSQKSSKTAHDHGKAAIFEIPSTGEVLCFQGSVNETYPALDSRGNAELYSVYRRESKDTEYNMWVDPILSRLTKIADSKGITEVADSGGGQKTISVPIGLLERSNFPSMSDDDWDPNSHSKEAVKRSNEAFEKFQNLIDERLISGKPKDGVGRPPISGPQPVPKITAKEMTGNRNHQKDALETWRMNGNRGILKHATGSGKTITAIAAVEDHLSKSEGNFAILVVPYKALQDQWGKELSKFGIRSLNIGGNSISDLQQAVLKHLRSGVFNENCVLNFVQNTFSKEETVSAIIKGGNSILDRCLFVFDECHHVGRPSYSRFTQAGIVFSSVLGLSATPFSPIDEDRELSDGWWEDRNISKFQMDAINRNNQIRELMGDVVHTFGLSEAIVAGYLTPYDYKIYRANMTEKEQSDYDKYRNLIPKQMNFDNPSAVHLSRSIVKSISAKIRVLKEIVKANYREGQNWLIYCSHDEFLDSARSVLKELDLEWWEYTSHNEDSRDIHMAEFKENGGLMLAVKCLDEGVDIPKISHGIILSSSTIEREFIQRRGRMLRSAPGKTKARIFDAVSTPHISASKKSIKSILKHEVSRIEHFKDDALNEKELTIELNMIRKIFDIRTRNAR